MNSTELQDFNTEITKHGYTINDFELDHVDLTKYKSDQIVPI